MIILIYGIIIVIIFSIVEYTQHQKYRSKIPTIIHVNGTRGKSSVVRLIAAGLRASNKKVIAKTTGSAPALIHDDGTETPIKRYHGANINEQMKIIKHVAKEKADILVLECMAVTPEYQWVTEQKMVKSNIGVLTNTRLDHLDVMGPGLRNCTLSMCNTVPFAGKLFTSERKMFPLIKTIGEKRDTETFFSEPTEISNEIMQKFNHIEHKDNVALALDICTSFGIKKENALKEMYKAKPDIGAAEIFEMKYNGKKLFFVHSFAANDPESTEFLINYVTKIHPHLENIALVLNTRADRIFRSKQLLKMVPEIKHNELFLVGDIATKMHSFAVSNNIDRNSVKSLGWVTGEKLVNEISKIDSDEILIFGIGNIGGNGKKIIEFFKERNIKNV